MEHTSMILTIGGLFFYTYNNEIKNLMCSLMNWTHDIFTSSISFETKYNPKLTYAFRQELDTQKSNTQHMEVFDGEPNLQYHVSNGTYFLCCGPTRFIKITLAIDNITIKGYGIFIHELKEFVDNIYSRHIIEDNITVFNISDLSSETKWRSVIRRPRNITYITTLMQQMLDNIEDFMNSETLYRNRGLPYKKTYFITGESKTGKTTMAEIISWKYNMTIYSIYFNDNNMTDATLIGLIATIPPRSLIIIDEIDKQYKSIITNKTVNISEGGLLNALDGPQRINHSCIVLLIANDLLDLPDKFKIPLLREGRTDEKYEFTEKFEPHK